MKILHKITKKIILEIETLINADLSSADLSGANLSGADLSSANLFGADLSGANLSSADLSSADLFGADLFDADLSSANLFGADLSGANLSSADLSSADLFGANLFGANLFGAILPNTDKILSCPWSICHIQRDMIRIGCEYHSTREWSEFTDEQINNMDKNKAISWWRENKEIVLFIASKCESYSEK